MADIMIDIGPDFTTKELLFTQMAVKYNSLPEFIIFVNKDDDKDIVTYSSNDIDQFKTYKLITIID